MGFIEKFFREMLIGVIEFFMNGVLTKINTQAVGLGEQIIVSPSAWNPTIWTMISNIADTVIVPIAGLILTCVMCLEFVGWVNEKNNFHNTADVIGHLIKYIIKLGIGVMLVQRAQELTMGIFDLSAWAIAQSTGIITTSPGEVAVSLDAVLASLATVPVGNLIGIALTTIIGWFVMDIVGLAIQFILVGRMIEIYIYCSMGSMPYATLTHKELGGIGQNYLKNLFALAFQGFFMLIMVAVYAALIRSTISNVAGTTDVTAMIFEMLLASGTLVMMLLRSKSIAKSIFSAH